MKLQLQTTDYQTFENTVVRNDFQEKIVTMEFLVDYRPFITDLNLRQLLNNLLIIYEILCILTFKVKNIVV